MTPETKTAILGFFLRSVRMLTVLSCLALLVLFGLMPLTHWLLNYQHPVLEALRQHAIQHLAEYLGFAAVLGAAYITNAPEICPFIPGEIDTPLKKMIQALWAWNRCSLQSALPGRFQPPTAVHTVTATTTPTTSTMTETTADPTKGTK